MGFNCGIVGLPNVGKSTLFNALTETAAAQAANYPFCTIEPNIGRVGVQDKRLDDLALIAGSKQIIYTQLEFVDIAGLVKGASKGEGLGNKFLSNIRLVDAIIHVLRCFEDDDITHTEGRVDPLSDSIIIETELILADMEMLERRVVNLEKKLRSQDKDAKKEYELVKKILDLLNAGRPAGDYKTHDEDEKRILKNLQLITAKPVMYVCNVSEEEILEGNELSAQIIKRAEEQNCPAVIISAKIEEEIALLDNRDEKIEFLETLGLANTGLNRIIQAGYGLLDLITYFTVGPKEARAWTIQKGTQAPQAAGVIHTDFEKGFIRAETVSYEDYIKYKGEQGAKDNGKVRLEGKDYIVNDGDVLHFRFNV